MEKLTVLFFQKGVVVVTKDTKTSIRSIIEKLTLESKSVFSHKVFDIAAEMGLGEMIVRDCLQQLMEENFISEPMQGVLRRV